MRLRNSFLSFLLVEEHKDFTIENTVNWITALLVVFIVRIMSTHFENCYTFRNYLKTYYYSQLIAGIFKA